MIPPALAGKPAQVLGNPDLPHTYTYIPDIGEALVLLAERDMFGVPLDDVFQYPDSPEVTT